MALIICPECGKEFSDRAPACPNCGCPVEKENETVSAPEPQKVEITKVSVNKSTKKIIIIVVAILAVIAAIIGIVAATKASSAKKEAEEARIAAEEAKEAYLSNLSLARTTMLLGAADAESAGGLIRDVWYNAIYEKYDASTNKYTRPNGYYVSDFNTALRNLFSDSSFTSKIDSIKSNQDLVSSLMKKLVNPPEEYKEAYNAIKDLYDVYTDLCNCAVNPTGNLTSYTSTFNEADSSFMKYYDAVGFYID